MVAYFVTYHRGLHILGSHVSDEAGSLSKTSITHFGKGAVMAQGTNR